MGKGPSCQESRCRIEAGLTRKKTIFVSKTTIDEPDGSTIVVSKSATFNI